MYWHRKHYREIYQTRYVCTNSNTHNDIMVDKMTVYIYRGSERTLGLLFVFCVDVFSVETAALSLLMLP